MEGRRTENIELVMALVLLRNMRPLRTKLPPMTRDLRLSEIIDSLRARLRPVCADWPEDMFEEVVRELATITLKYEGSATPSLYDRRRTERLVEDLKEIIGRNEKARDSDDESFEAGS